MSTQIITQPVAVFLTIIAVILIMPILSEWVRLPSIAGLILGGILIGPHGFNLLGTGATIQLLSTVGLIYLMFSAGLEINLNQFNRVRNKSLLFGLLTFSLPLASGIGLGRLIGLSWTSALLLGSIYASHTLIAFPILSKLGIVKNEAIAVTIGATVFTDVSALLILAILAASESQGGSLIVVARLFGLMVAYTLGLLLGLPRVGKLFFKRFTGRSVEFQFVLVALFVAAFLAQVIGMQAIVGAFLAGLAINYTLPPRSHVLGQVLFLGESFFIPMFLIYVGMIIDPLAILANLRSIEIGLLLIVAVYTTKFLAAWIAARIYHYSRNEMLTMWGLSQAQAAATLATVLVGVQIGLLNDEIFNGTILMILFTTITSSLIVQRFGSRIHQEPVESEPEPLFNRILISVANPQTQEHLINMAAILARTGEGTLMPINVAIESRGNVHGLANQRQLLDSPVLHDEQTDVEAIARVDNSISQGIIRASLENQATLIVTGWRGDPTFRQSLFGTIIDEIVWGSKIPVMVCRLTIPTNAMTRILLVVSERKLNRTTLDNTMQVVRAIGEALNIPIVILAQNQEMQLLENYVDGSENDLRIEIREVGRRIVREVARASTEEDLILITSSGPRAYLRSGLGALPEEVASATTASIVVFHNP